MNNKKIIIIGGQGNGAVIASCVDHNRKVYQDYEWEIEGFLNDFETCKTIVGFPILGKTDLVQDYLKKDYYFMFAINMINNRKKSEELFLKMNIPIDRLATVVHKSSYIAPGAVLEPGVFVYSNCSVLHETKIGYCTLLKANSVIGHHCIIGNQCSFSSGSVVSGYVEVGKLSYVGLNATVLSGRKIGNYSMAAANSLVTKDIPDNEIHYGSPAKFFKPLT